MPVYDFRCNACGTVHEELVRIGTFTNPCPQCGHPAQQVILRAPSLDTWSLALNGVSPESKKKLNRMLKGQKDKEEKSLKEHGDYGSSQGYRTPPSNN